MIWCGENADWNQCQASKSLPSKALLSLSRVLSSSWDDAIFQSLSTLLFLFLVGAIFQQPENIFFFRKKIAFFSLLVF